MYTSRKDDGFTLIEVMIAIIVLVIGILSLYSMQVRSVKENYRANRMTLASTWNSSMVERFIGMKFSSASLKDNDGDGTGQDGNKDGVDDDGGNFGLDDATNATADGMSTTSDNKYTIYWNVAVDVPMPNLKTIRVIIQDNKNVLRQPVVFTYIKDDLI
ncbi:MAG TPA: prepilin-type N-terminal cleavage/methylation domain-containing protein [Desulfobulbus sp.]|nr:prepilin-type N-terminal cleavage/methylation domain-containing protein [Desulfobulbus sp.]